MKKLLKILAIFGIGLLLFQSASPAQSLPKEALDNIPGENLKFLDEVFSVIKKHFYDKEFSGLDLDKLKDDHKDSVMNAKTNLELHQAVNEMIAKFKVSHFAVIEKQIYQGIENERTNTLAPEFGFKLRKIDKKYFATRFSEGGAAEKAGLKYGDEIIRVNGVAVADSDMMIDNGNDVGIPGPEFYVLKAAKDETVKLEIRRTKDSKTLNIKITAVDYNETKSTENSVKIIEKDGKKIAYMHAWHFLTRKIADIFHEAIDDEFADCDALMLDVRGHGGSPLVIQMFLASFTEVQQNFRNRTPKWDKPLVVLTDEGTRSAKEIFANAVHRDKLGTLVGRQTQGAVLGSNFYPLSDGSALIIPVVEGSRYTRDGKVLEGNGVDPDIVVPLQIEYADGVDEIYERGLKEAIALLSKKVDEPEKKSENKDESAESDF